MATEVAKEEREKIIKGWSGREKERERQCFLGHTAFVRTFY